MVGIIGGDAGLCRSSSNGGLPLVNDEKCEARTRFRVHPAFAGYRLDQFLMQMIPKLSRNRIQKAIASRVRLSWNAPVKPSTPVREGEEVIIADPEIEEKTITFEPRVLYEDEDVLAIDKPPGLVVHPTHNHLKNTVITLLRQRRGEPELTLAHRLDAETSGVLLLSRRRWAARKLQMAFERAQVDKFYRALVFGHPAEERFNVELPLGYHSEDDVVYRQSPRAREAKPCKTRFRVLSHVGPLALVEAELLTGRRHQIRAHLALAGHPVVGDKLYGLDDRDYRRYLRLERLDEEHLAQLLATRCLLHCERMELAHPRPDKGRLSIHSEIPADMLEVIENQGRTRG